MRKIILFFLTLLTSSIGISQTGPGGVGMDDGTSSLEVWLLPDFLRNMAGSLPSDGQTVATWIDNSGNGNTLTNSGTAIYESANGDLVNGNAKLSCDKLDQEFSTSSNVTGKTIFVVCDPATYSIREGVVGFAGDVGIRRGATSGNFWLSLHTANNNNNDWSEDTGTFRVNGENTSVHGNQLHQFSAVRSSSVTNIFYVGGYFPSRSFSGDILEVIMYSTDINSAQEIIITNHLSAKYDIDLASNDLYNGDNVGYDFDVAGIGRVDASNIQDDSQGTGIVRILNPRGLGDDEFLIWGHDNVGLDVFETTDVPATVQIRLARVWRVSEVNSSRNARNVGNVDVRFDLTELGSIITASGLSLLVDNNRNGDFSDDQSAIIGATALGGNVYQFTNVSSIANNRSFTLGISTTQTPLPIEIISFSATPLNNKLIKLEWQTASETNNDYYTTERSKNGVEWEEVSIIDGAGNSSTVLSYSSYDENPMTGVSYYRLKQTDFNGEHTYSQLKSINLNKFENQQIQIYPNPAGDQIYIIGDAFELEEIRIFNSLGSDASMPAKVKYISEEKVIIDLSQLESGIYFIETRTTSNKVSKQ